MMDYTKGNWKAYGQHIHLDAPHTSDEIVSVLCPGWMDKAEAKANALLIAAAPALAEACEELVAALTRWLDTAQQDSVFTVDIVDKADRLARQALAKAEGKERG